jgi:oxygen-dependent protoporphyrinogen oxidase
MSRVVIVGAGISGLALAHRLQALLPAAEILTLEEQARPGGVIDSVRRDGFLIESGPNGFLDSNPVTVDLARALGLGEQLLPASEPAGKNRFLFLDGRLRLLPSSLVSFLRSDLLSWTGKLDLLAERFRPRRRDPAEESIDSFARRRAGREVARTLADAFVTGILAGDPRLLGLEACFPRLAAFEREHGSVQAGLAAARRQRRANARPADTAAIPARARMWSFSAGLRTLVDALAASLRQAPLTGAGVRRIRREAGAWLVEAGGASAWHGDAVVLACPAYRQAEVLGDLDADLAERVGGIAYNRVAVVVLGYRREDVPHRLDGFGYLTPQRQGRDVLGVQWCSSIFPGHRAPAGLVQLRALCGGWQRGEMLDWSDDRLLAAVRSELACSLGVRAAPVMHHIVSWQRAIPQYLVGHLERLAWIEQRLLRHPGLFLAGSAYRGVAINDCVEQAGVVAERVAAWLGQASAHSRDGSSGFQRGEMPT